MIKYAKTNKVAKKLIDSLYKDGKVNLYGEKISKYELLLEQEDEQGNLKRVFVNITLENDWFNGDFYSVHCINQMPNNSCSVALTTTTEKAELNEVLKDIVASALMNIHKPKQPKQEQMSKTA